MSEHQQRKPSNDIDRSSPVAVVMRQWPATVPVLVQRKMACAGCALSPFCTIEDVARDYAVEVEPLLEELRHAADGGAGTKASEARRALPKQDCERRTQDRPSRIQGLAAAFLMLFLLVGTGCSRLPDDTAPDQAPGPSDAPAFQDEIPAAEVDESIPSDSEAAIDQDSFMGRPASPERPAPNFELLDQQGQAWRPETAQGRALVLFFGYTHCPDICPNTMAVLSRAMDELGDAAADVQIALVSVDPERDTPEILGAYVQAFAPDALGLHGDLEMTERVAEAYGVRFEKEYPELASADGESSAGSAERYSVAHSGTVFLIDTYGQIRITHGGVLSPDEIAHDLELILKERVRDKQ